MEKLDTNNLTSTLTIKVCLNKIIFEKGKKLITYYINNSMTKIRLFYLKKTIRC